MSAESVLLITRNTVWCDYAVELARLAFGDNLEVARGEAGEPFPERLKGRQYPALFSFLSLWVVPDSVLARSEVAINFHSGPREYPGVGCYNFALYEETREYGAVCHHMVREVDAGPIIVERRFPIRDEESVESLKFRTMIELMPIFHEIVTLVAGEKSLPRANVNWSRPAFTRKQLDELGTVTPDMPNDELHRRLRAMTYPGYPGLRVRIGDVEFETPAPDRKPIA